MRERPLIISRSVVELESKLFMNFEVKRMKIEN